MTGRMELGFPKTSSKMSATSLKEQAARMTLRKLRAQGHTYVEIREEGKRFIFFCTLCLAPCYSETVLFDHLKGNLHTKQYATAKVTLLASNPWPFSDGVHFFDNTPEEVNNQLMISNGNTSSVLDTDYNDNNLAIVKHSVNSNKNLDTAGAHSGSEVSSGDTDVNTDGGDCDLVVPSVLLKDVISDLKLRYIGLGQITARFREKDGASNEITRIWCEWLGKTGTADEVTFSVQEHDFALINFSYKLDLGRMDLLEDLKTLVSSSSMEEIEIGEGTGRKRKKSFSDTEDVSVSLGNQYDSCGEDSLESNSPKSRLVLDDHFLHKSIISDKNIRRELRRRQQVAAEKTCSICQHKLLPGKDVATILNLNTKRLACSSRNPRGAFHVYHTSCLIHWILLCEYEIHTNQSVSSKMSQGSRRKTASKCNEKEKVGENGPVRILSEIHHVFCPECHGTGTHADELNRPKYHLSKVFRYKIKMSDAHRAWMKSPEVTHNCSTGFHFPPQSEETAQERVSPIKLLHFYGADT